MYNYQTYYYYYVLVLSYFSSTFKYFHSITLFVLRQYCVLHLYLYLYAPVNRVLYQHNGIQRRRKVIDIVINLSQEMRGRNRLSRSEL